MIKVFLYLTNVVWRTNLQLWSSIKYITHSSIKRNESGILCWHSARSCCFKTSHYLAFWYRITVCTRVM